MFGSYYNTIVQIFTEKSSIHSVEIKEAVEVWILDEVLFLLLDVAGLGLPELCLVLCVVDLPQQ